MDKVNENKVRSMTAFASQSVQDDWGNVTWEIRSVNHRYLDMSLRIPEALRDLETWVRETLRKRIQRGKLECVLRYQLSTSCAEGLQLNSELLEQLLKVTAEITQQTKELKPLSVADLLAWPGVVTKPEADVDILKKAAKATFSQAIDNLIAAREREGVAMHSAVSERISRIEQVVSQLVSDLPDFLVKLKDKMLLRVKEIQESLDPSRFEQEVALLAQKSDIAEEIDRLMAHINEAKRILTKGGAVGRRLDFLMQEFNREANTIASKASEIGVTQAALEMKVSIEQMREQIQNIE